MATHAPSSTSATKDVAAKLLIKPGSSLWVSDDGILPAIGALPPDVGLAPDPANATTVVLVARDKASLRDLLRRHRPELAGPTALWVAYPKADRVDLSRDTVWPVLTEFELRPIGQAAIGEAWSAMRFRPLAPGEKPFTGGR